MYSRARTRTGRDCSSSWVGTAPRLRVDTRDEHAKTSQLPPPTRTRRRACTIIIIIIIKHRHPQRGGTPSPALRAYNNIIMYSNYFALLTAAAAAAATEFIARRPVIAACVLWSGAAERGGGGVSAPRLSPVWRLAADAKSPVTRAIPAGRWRRRPLYSGTHTRTHCTTPSRKNTLPRVTIMYTAARW